MSINSNKLDEQILTFIKFYFYDKEHFPNPEQVRELCADLYDKFLPLYPETAGDRESTVDKITDEYCSQSLITKQIGYSYEDEETEHWLNAADETIEDQNGWFYWSRYRHYLQNKWSKNVVRTIERDTYSVLDLMANPQQNKGFERKGLVVASVQSGKTANYVGLISRAADAGYKIIIVMAGVHNVLRNQTQVRIEEGFTGIRIVENSRIEPVGVGLHDSSRRPIVCTARDSDFNKNRANALKGVQTTQTEEPWIFVIKKNSNSLKQVYEWLKDNADIDDPLLLIDDEADNASINGKYKRERRDDEPTRINGQIRNILNYFSRKCYVGYTATPYANILIDPTIDTDKFGKDLFPSSFIYTLEDSSDYFGASKVFGDYDDDNSSSSLSRPKHLRFIDDIDSVLPPKHKSDFSVDRLPNSLERAICIFVVASSIRALRGDEDEHSTMMVNVSPYKQPQKSVAWEITDFVRTLRDEVKSWSALESALALDASPYIKRLHDAWYEEYSNTTEFTWEQIQSTLLSTIRSIRVVSVNTDSAERLEYDTRTEHVIAVGGYRLSRGLTLEGLVVSYYSRNAKAYDALMQMARWFGYRPKYEDLCRIWMSDTAAGWYKFVADSTDDLVDELRNMRQVKGTPKDYGLRIRLHPDSLLVTARNKNGTGTKVEAPIDLNNGFTETIAFDRSRHVVDQNRDATTRLLGNIGHYKRDSLYKHVPVEHIIEFIRSYKNEDFQSPKSQSKPVISYIEDRILDGELKEWDVFIAEGRGPETMLAPEITVHSEIRYPGSNTNKDSLLVGEKQRLASRGIERNGLSDAQVDSAKRKFRLEHGKEKSISDRYYRRERTYPLLVIHPVLMKYSEAQRNRLDSDNSRKPPAGAWPSWDHEESAIGWSISFPYTPKQTRPVEYLFNQVALESISRDYEEESDDDFEDD